MIYYVWLPVSEGRENISYYRIASILQLWLALSISALNYYKVNSRAWVSYYSNLISIVHSQFIWNLSGTLGREEKPLIFVFLWLCGSSSAYEFSSCCMYPFTSLLSSKVAGSMLSRVHDSHSSLSSHTYLYLVNVMRRDCWIFYWKSRLRADTGLPSLSALLMHAINYLYGAAGQYIIAF